VRNTRITDLYKPYSYPVDIHAYGRLYCSSDYGSYQRAGSTDESAIRTHMHACGRLYCSSDYGSYQRAGSADESAVPYTHTYGRLYCSSDYGSYQRAGSADQSDMQGAE